MDRENKTAFNRLLNKIEHIGNKLPNPFILFIALAVFIIIISWVLSFFNISFTLPNEEVVIKSLISTEGLRFIVTSMIDNFISFKLLGILLSMLLCNWIYIKVGLLER